MYKPRDPRELAIALLTRSVCSVAVACVLADKHGIFAWGWNSAGSTGYGEHAEAAAVRRASRSRLEGSTAYVVARRRKSRGTITARPCEACRRVLGGVKQVVYRDQEGWHEI